jgi:hypothetical protein
MLPKLIGCSIGGVAGGQEWLRCAIRSRGNVDERLHGDLFATIYRRRVDHLHLP